MTVELKEHERLDDLQNGYYIIQNTQDFCYGIDAVLLSGFAKVKKGERALDMGTGTGIIPILLKAKTQGEHFTGLEIQERSAEMARRSVAYNHLEDTVTIRTGDIKEPNMVLIEGLSGGNPRITVEKPLIVYQSPGVYTPEIYDIYGY